MITINQDKRKKNPVGKEEAQIEKAFRQVTDAANHKGSASNAYVPNGQDKKPKKQSKSGLNKKQKRIIGICAGVVATVLALAIGIGTWWFLDYTEDDGRIYSNVYAYGINLGGMTPEEAEAALHDLTDQTYAMQNLTIQLPDSTLVFSPAETGARVNVERLVDMAYGYGREGNRWENTQARAEAMLTSHELDVMSCVTLDQAYIRDVVDQLAQATQSNLIQSTVAVTGEVPKLEMKYEDALKQTDLVHKTMTITVGTPDRTLDTQALLDAIFAAYETNCFDPIVMDYALTEPDPIDLEALFAEHCIAPVDAILDETDYTVSDEILGYGFDAAALQTQLEGAEPGQVIEVTFQYLPAAVTRASLEANLFRDVLASVSTNHTNNSNRNTNLKLACKAINGMIIRPGETFSYNKALGERTEAKGYKPAGAYVGGKNVDTIGGGICQVSSSLYYAVLKSDLEIVERYAHGYTVSYLPYGMDATVSWGSLDFKWRNNTDYPIRIQASVSGGQVHIKLIGTDTKDYYIKMTYETVSGPHYGETVYEEYPANNPEGYKDGEEIQNAYTGRTVKTYRCRYSKETDKLISSKYEATSTYKKRDQIICKILPEETEPTTPPVTTPPSSSETTQPPSSETTAPPVTTQPPATTQPPETTQPPATTQPPETEATEPTTASETEPPVTQTPSEPPAGGEDGE